MLKGSILQRLSDAHKTGARPLHFGVYYKNTLVSLCHALEDSILSSSSSPLMITAFQRGKWYLQEADRYGAIAKTSRQVVIMAAADSAFAEHPTSQMPNVDLVNLNATDPVAQEWHLIILSPTYTAMVLCQELSVADYGPGGLPEVDLERKFYGFWTFEPGLVLETVELAIAHIGRYNPELQQTLTAHLQAMTSIGAQQPEDLSAVVSRVVDYLHSSHHELIGEKHAEIPASHHQALDINLVSNELQAFVRMAQLMELANTGNPMATAEVAAVAETMGQLLDLPAWQLKRLRLAGLLHGLVPSLSVQPPEIENPKSKIETPTAPSCPLLPGIQALRAMPQLQAIASIITHLTEWWNGTGTPAELAYDGIPLESRILGLVTDFQWRVSQHLASQVSQEEALGKALADCQVLSGDRWDPKLVETLALLVKGLQQGLTLPVAPPRVSAGMWLLDENQESNPTTNRVSH
jgi:DICT domain-containing protein